METANTPLLIPQGTARDEIATRKQIILDFYQRWKEEHPTQRLFNLYLKEFINIRSVSLDETSRHASASYLSTLAVMQLDAILTNAKPVATVKTKASTTNQKSFSKMIIMCCELPGIGLVKVTVGVRHRSFDKVQYCITAIGVGEVGLQTAQIQRSKKRKRPTQ